jgi:hypothetical protein
MKRLIAPILFLAFAAIAIVGCKKLDDPLPVDRLKSILLGKDTVTMYAGEKRSVPVTISPSNYSLDSIRWKSLDTNILSISKVGLVTGKKPGTTTVSVSNLTSTISVNLKITVKDSIEMGLIAYYPFNNSGEDLSGKMNDVAYYSNVTSTTNRSGKANSAFSFNGVNSYLMIKDHAGLRLSNTDFTINTWVKMEDYNPNDLGSLILSKRFSGSNKGYNFGINGVISTPIGSIQFGPGGGLPSVTSTTLIGKGSWYMITMVYNLSTSKMKVYRNGVYDTEATILPLDGSINADLYIGRDNPSIGTNYFLKGSIDDIRIYNRALTAQQIQRLYVAPN